MVATGNESMRGSKTGPLRISTLVFLLAGALIALSSFALLFVGFIATHTANRQAHRHGTQLFDNAIHERMMLIARDQLSVARWDKTVANVVLAFDKAYVQNELVDALWYDFGHDRMFFIGANGRLVAEAERNRVDFSGHGPLSPDVQVAAKLATTLHMANRIEIDGGFGQRSVPSAYIDKIAALGYGSVDGRPSLISAMAIVPDDGDVALPEGPPAVLVSVKFIDADLLSDLTGQLAFRGLMFSAQDENGPLPTRAVRTISGLALGSFVWHATPPSAHIWPMVIPLIALIAGLLAIAAFYVARKIGRLTSRLEESEAKNRHLASHDPLTGLANRLHFDAALAQAVAGLPQTPFAAIACDLDRFKAVNDTCGHAAGDAVLQTVAERLKEIVADDGLVGRIGGDEFVILITGFSDHPRLTLLSRQIIAAVGTPIPFYGGVTEVGTSLGIAVAPDAGSTCNRIMAAADAALYLAKERGRGVAVFADDVSQPGRTAEADAPALPTDAVVTARLTHRA